MPIYDVRVAGEFSKQSSAAVISLGLLEEAKARYVGFEEETSELHLGVDVANYGDDDSAIAARRGLQARIHRTVNGYGTIEVVGMVRQALTELRQPGERASVKIDRNGNGAGVYDTLVAQNEAGELGPGVQVIGVMGSQTSDDPERYPNMRCQLWFAIRSFFKGGGAIEEHGKLEGELTAPEYKPDAQGRFLVEKKDETKKKIKRSPDHADALALAIYQAEGRIEKMDTSGIANFSRWEGYGEEGTRGFG
jgi:hypothetical protein